VEERERERQTEREKHFLENLISAKKGFPVDK
jgi:hypothetical protein